MNWEHGELTSVSGAFIIRWDFRHTSGMMYYDVEELFDGGHYVAHYDDGWRIAPRHHNTVDMQRFIPEEDDLCMELIDTLNRASGRIDTPGIHVIGGE